MSHLCVPVGRVRSGGGVQDGHEGLGFEGCDGLAKVSKIFAPITYQQYTHNPVTSIVHCITATFHLCVNVCHYLAKHVQFFVHLLIG